MNVVVKHPAQHSGLPAVVTDPAEKGEMVPARIPHVSIHVFHETETFGALWRRAKADRRLVGATTAAREGGFAAAIDAYSRERSPDLIIVETTASEALLPFQVDSLADVCQGETRLIVIGERNDIQLYRRLMDMGVSAYLVAPVTIATMISSIADIYRDPGKQRIGRVTAVLGAKGGVGASRVAQSLALELSKRRASDVLLVDLDITFGTAGLDLDVEPNQGLTELLLEPDRIDADMLDRVIVRRGEHLALLGASAELERGSEIDEDAVDRVIEVAQSHVRQVVLDIPHLWAPWIERAIIAADDVIVVSTPELGSLRNAVALIARTKALRPNDQAPHLVLNQVGVPRRQEITRRDIRQVLEIEPAVSIPFDARAFSLAAARGRMVTEMSPRRPLAQAYARLADLLDPNEAVGRRRRRWFRGGRREVGA